MLRNSMKQMICLWPAIAALNFTAVAGSTTNAMNTSETNKIEIADLGGGCFWCMEAVFDRLPGVISVTSGFAGGHTANPTYEQVCTETTGHAEVTQIEFDPGQNLLRETAGRFLAGARPDHAEPPGRGRGHAYRSIILYRNEAQKLMAEKSKTEAQKNFKHPIVTEIAPLTKFYKAEDYHQEYYDQQFQRALLPDGHRAQAAQAGEGKGDSNHVADQALSSRPK